jgi:hypothetical protein
MAAKQQDLSRHETEKRLSGFEERLGEIDEKEKLRKEDTSQIREGDNEGERDAILKKRMVCEADNLSIAILVASIQKLIKRRWHELTFDYIINDPCMGIESDLDH